MSTNVDPAIERQREIFFKALEKSTPAERAAFLDGACGDDLALRAEVERLLQHYHDDSFMESPPMDNEGMGRVASIPSEAPGTVIDCYKLLQKIGEGGCGVVYMAEQEEPVRRRVALKVIKLGMDTRSFIARFEAERQALAMMDHPNIAKVLEAGATETGRPYFVMELVRGIKITDYCDGNNLSTRQRLDLFSQVCQAIQHAHQKGIIHRDIKPSNILVTVYNGVPVPIVIDFGVAKATQGRLTDKTLFTAFEQFIGTPAYMSPEQAVMTNLDIDTRSDIYALGVLLYELLTGKTPFEAKELLAAGLDEMRRTIREKEPPRPSTRLSTMLEGELTTTASHRHIEAPKLIRMLRGDLDWMVMKCLEKDRTRRYETANGLAMDIQRHLNNEPVVACPPSTFYRFQKLVRRNKLALAAAGAVAAALIIGLGVSTWMFFKEKVARQRAIAAEEAQFMLRQQAERAASKSQQVAQFLKDMLEGVRPSVALGRDTTVLKEMMARTAARLGNELHEHPDVQAELLQTLGDAAFLLDDFAQAEAWLTQAVALRKGQFGEQHAEVANSLDSLALSFYGQGKYADAERIGREALNLQRITRGPSHTNVATSLNNLGITLTELGRPDAALEAYQAALNIRTNQLGQEHPEVAVTLNTMAQALFRKGKLQDAEIAQRRALSIQSKHLPDPHPDLALSLNNLANFLQVQGKLDQADPVYHRTIKMQKALLGENSTDLATTLNNHGLLLEKMGLWSDAETAHLSALHIRTNTFTNDHLHVAFSLNNLASLRASRGELAQAADFFGQALEMRRRLVGEANPDVAASIGNLARLLRYQGRFEEAETMQNDALARRRNLPPEGEHPSIAVSLNELGLLRRAQDRPADAAPLLREALDRRLKVLRSDDSTLAESAENLALVLCDLGEFVEAEKHAQQSAAIREQNFPDDWRRFNAIAIAGAALLGQKQFAAAEPLLLSGCKGMEERRKRIPFESKPRLKEALKSLVQLYDETARSSEAAEWRQKLEAFDKAEK